MPVSKVTLINIHKVMQQISYAGNFEDFGYEVKKAES